MLHILVGFESHRKDSAAESLYVGNDSTQVQALVDSNLSRFAVIRCYKGPAYSKRWVSGEATAEAPLAEAPLADAPPADAPPADAPPADAPPADAPPADAPPADEIPAEESPSGKKSKK